MDTPLLLRAIGGILGFWVCFFLGSRTAYHPSTRWLRWSCVFAVSENIAVLSQPFLSRLDTMNMSLLPALLI